MNRYIKREDAVFAACKVLDTFGGCKMGPLCPDVGCCEVRDIIDAFPMIEIPEKHGRCVDADVLCKVLQKNSEDEWNNKTAPFSWAYAYDCVKDTVENMPTIIPADVPDNNVGNIPSEEGEQ